MNATEPKNAFLLMRANGWSLRSISKELGIPKSTLFDWESDPPTCRAINVFKALQLEKLQERYIPSFEEELQKLSTCLDRVERALEKQDYDAMRPEFLLRTSLQLRARLNTLRSDIQPIRTLHQGELPPVPLPGCISRSRTILEPTTTLDPLPWGEGRVRGKEPSKLLMQTFRTRRSRLKRRLKINRPTVQIRTTAKISPNPNLQPQPLATAKTGHLSGWTALCLPTNRLAKTSNRSSQLPIATATSLLHSRTFPCPQPPMKRSLPLVLIAHPHRHLAPARRNSAADFQILGTLRR